MEVIAECLPTMAPMPQEPISAIEETAARAWPAAEVELLDGWRLRYTEGVTRRVLIVWGTSVAPNTFALGIDQDRDVMVVHRLVAEQEGK